MRSITSGLRRLLFLFCVWALVVAGPGRPEAASAGERPRSAAPELVVVEQGGLPIILSAPHGGKEAIPGAPPRENKDAFRFLTGGDLHTLELAQKVAAALEKRLHARPYLVLARFQRKYVDANRAAQDAYESPQAKPHYDAYHAALRAACQEVARQWGRGLMVDLHGQSVEQEGIFRGTASGASMGEAIERFGPGVLNGPNSIAGDLERRGYKLIPAANEGQKEGRFNGGYITRTYGRRELSIDAIQLEFGAALRASQRLDRTASDVAAAIETFARAYLPASKLQPEKKR